MRLSIKAIIRDDDKCVLIKNIDQNGFWYVFPGGGQEKFETMTEALKREVIEETGLLVIPHEIVGIRDYIGKNHEFAHDDAETHQVEVYFNCSLAGDKTISEQPANPDTHQVGVEWVAIADIPQLRVYPRRMTPQLLNGGRGVYYGDIN